VSGLNTSPDDAGDNPQATDRLYKKLIRLTIYVFTAWLIHLVFVSIYINLFESYDLFGFRAVHFTEVLLVSYVVYSFYFRSRKAMPFLSSVILVLGVLVGVDILFWLVTPGVFEGFDLGHFVAVYVAVILAIYFSSKKPVNGTFLE
jgi:hypothetical protein